MKHILTIISLVIPLIAFCQDDYGSKATANAHPIRFDNCKFIPFIWEDGSHWVEFQSGNNKLSGYFSEKLDIEKRRSVTGTVGIQVLIDSTGKGCCRSVYIKKGIITLDQLGNLKLQDIIDAMPAWIIKNPIEPGKRVQNYCIIIEMDFSKGNVVASYNPGARRVFIK